MPEEGEDERTPETEKVGELGRGEQTGLIRGRGKMRDQAQKIWSLTSREPMQLPLNSQFSREMGGR